MRNKILSRKIPRIRNICLKTLCQSILNVCSYLLENGSNDRGSDRIHLPLASDVLAILVTAAIHDLLIQFSEKVGANEIEKNDANKSD